MIYYNKEMEDNMAKQHFVKCRICKQQFDTTTLVEGIEWIQPSPRWYYHCKCYEDWAKKKNDIHATQDGEAWMSAAYDFLKKELKMSVNYHMFRAQWESFTKKQMTPKGIYFTLKYFYDIQHGKIEKANGGIGIVPYIYTEATQYWIKREVVDKGICQRIMLQLEQFKDYNETKEVKEVKKQTGRKNRLGSFEDLERMDS